ncbi:RNA polymerase sigma factor region1.1 domain-containing protein, partial [Massilia alkalitolerans]|uniref:RNA polymerase sigma factor region1.1 domain-containing protein n=1 Tax=Massilia alkalitolerans TaxID=286638 RepID=UPI0028B13982
MKNTAKTLTLTAKKAPAKATAQLAVPKTATSYFLETEAAAKVTVVKTRSRLASAKAALEAEQAPGEVEAAANEAVLDTPAVAEPVAEVVEAVAEAAPAAPVAQAEAAPAAEPAPFEDYTAAVPNAAATVVVRKRGSKLAALKAAAAEEAPQAAAEAAPAAAAAPAAPVAEEAPAAPKVVRTRTRRTDANALPAPAAASTAVGAVSATTDAAALAAIDTSGYLLPQVKVPGRRGRKPSEFVPENDEVAALNAVERAEMKAASKLRERKAKGLAGMLGGDSGFSEAELEKRRQQIKNLINMGKERGYLTHAQINDQLPENIVDPEAIEGIIATFNDMGIAIYERAPE